MLATGHGFLTTILLIPNAYLLFGLCARQRREFLLPADGHFTSLRASRRRPRSPQDTEMMSRRRQLLILVTLTLSVVVVSARQGVPGSNPLAGSPAVVSEGYAYNQLLSGCHCPPGSARDRGPGTE